MRNDQNDVGSMYGATKERIFDDARRTDTVLVIGTKDGKPHIWSDGEPAQAQKLLATVFPSAVLPERQLEGADDRR